MPRTTERPGKPERRTYADAFKRDADVMLLDGHSATSIVERLGISGTNLLYRWKQQRVDSAKPIGKVLDCRVAELEAPNPLRHANVFRPSIFLLVCGGFQLRPWNGRG